MAPSPQCPRSERLRYRPLAPDTLYDFHRLVQDEHVRRYMMDGHVFPLEWSEQHMRDSQALLARRGVGIWLAYAADTSELAGFCGFATLSPLPEPQILYALFGRFAGHGLATEMARASIAMARAQTGFGDIVADVDEVNAASVRVLAKLGFERVDVRPGAFGNVLVLRLASHELERTS
jgi:[ribosomal protein S5]-alanine N-acetyltransferase